MPFQLPEPIRLRRFHWIPFAGLVLGVLAGGASVLTDNPWVDIHQTHPSAEGAVFKVDLLGVNVVEEAYTVEVSKAAKRAMRAERSRGKDRRGKRSSAEREARELRRREFNSRSRPWIIAVSAAGAVFVGLLGWVVAFVADRTMPVGGAAGGGGDSDGG